MRRLARVAFCCIAFVATAVFAAPAGRNAPDAIPMPKGNTQQLVTFIQNLQKEKPADAADQAKQREAIIAAADKILAGKANEQEAVFAAGAKATALQNADDLSDFEESLKKAAKKPGRKAAARVVHGRLLAVQLDQAAANAAYFRTVFDDVVEHLRSGTFQESDVALAIRAGTAAEQTGDDTLAGETYERLAETLSSQPTLAGAVKQMQANARRFKLVGNPMLLVGKTVLGNGLDWEAYRGKVVLVDFWATWCNPCMIEIQNIKTNYEKYHDKGFEVIGISLDRKVNAKDLAAFAIKENMPWTICRDADSPQSMVEYYGITTIPRLILVGRDGTVVSLRTQGQALGPAIEKALNESYDPSRTAKTKPAAKGSKLAKKDRTKPKPKSRDVDAAKRTKEHAANTPQFRKWADASGKFHRTAKYRGMINGTVKLELEDGTTLQIPLEKLSDADQEYISQRGK